MEQNNHPYSHLNEQDVRSIIGGRHEPRRDQPGRKRRSKLAEAFRLVFVFVVLFGLSFLLVNAPAYSTRLSYWWNVEYRGKKVSAPSTSSTPTPTNGSPIATPEPQKPLDTSQPAALEIEKIGLKHVPIVWNAAPDEIIARLAEGVAHYKGTAIPGSREHQNVFITGHSSNWWWDTGAYNSVFSLLDKLVAGDTIKITSGDQTFVYRVREGFSITPDQTEVLRASDTPILTLMTCWPVGTNARRWIIIADQIEPPPVGESAGGAVETKKEPAPFGTILDLFRTFIDQPR
jgi:sortase A